MSTLNHVSPTSSTTTTEFSPTSHLTPSKHQALISFESQDCLPASKFPTLQGYLLEHSNLAYPSRSSPSSSSLLTPPPSQTIKNNQEDDSSNTCSTPSSSPAGTNSSPSSVASSLIGRKVATALRRKRSFVFSPKTGKLYKFRSQNDNFPIAEIDIRSASFIIHRQNTSGGFGFGLGSTLGSLLSSSSSSSGSSPSSGISSRNSGTFSGTASLQPFVFEIVVGSKNILLEANSSEEGFVWIENLQTYRQFLCNKYLGVELSTGVDTERPLRDVSPNSFISYIANNQNTQESTKSSIPVGEIVGELFTPTHPISPSAKASTTMNNYSPTSADKPASTKMFSGIVSRMRQNSTNSERHSSSPSMQNLDYSSSPLCSQCRILEDKLINLTDDQVALEDEVKTNRDVIKILQEQLRIFNSEKLIPDLTDSPTDFDSLSREIISMKIQMKSLDKENEKLRTENRSLVKTKEVLEEMLENRDRTMVSLTHQVYDLESKNSRMATRAELEKEFLQDELDDRIRNRLEQLQDTVLAFEHQNEFLNKEIIQQNEFRARLELREKQTQSQVCELEAKCSQVQSKLLSLLKELNQCIQEEERSNSEDFHNLESSRKNPLFVTNESVKLLVNRLLEESSLDIPLSWRPGNRARNWSVSENVPEPTKEYDELGFYVLAPEVSSAGRQHNKGYDLNMDAELAGWRDRWDQFMSNISSPDASLSSLKKGELKGMLRNGVPQDYRCKIWKMLVNRRICDKRSRCGDTYYESLTKHCGPSSIVSPTKGNAHTASSLIDPSTKQIELDLLRTLPHNKHFENLESEGIKRLRKVLQAFSLHNQAVGYCQGLNRLAAVSLLFMPEEEAFWTLVAIVETIMPPEYFSRNLLGAHVDQCVLRDLIAEKLPNLSAHMEEYCIEISLFGWFLTAFVDSMPVQVYLHIWDVFLNEGSKVLFRFALAILKLYEPELLLMNDSVSFNQFLRTLGEKHFDLRRLSDIAFKGLNPFSTKLIQGKRQHYTAMVKDELRKIEEIRDQIHAQVKKQDDDEEEVRKTKVVKNDKEDLDKDLEEHADKKNDLLISFDDDSDN